VHGCLPTHRIVPPPAKTAASSQCRAVMGAGRGVVLRSTAIPTPPPPSGQSWPRLPLMSPLPPPSPGRQPGTTTAAAPLRPRRPADFHSRPSILGAHQQDVHGRQSLMATRGAQCTLTLSSSTIVPGSWARDPTSASTRTTKAVQRAAWCTQMA